MIQIDDAGSGSLIGGTVIGIYRMETGEYIYDIIPLEFYSEENMRDKAYLSHVTQIVKHGFQQLNVSISEPIEVCRGYMFDELRKWFKTEKYQYKNTVITGALQEKVEKTFVDYIISLGLPEGFIKYTKYPFHFHRILKWVYADYEHRYKLCKVGWKSWNKYGHLTVKQSYGSLISNKNFYCLKCGNKINTFDEIKILSFYSNKNQDIFLHRECNET